MPTYEYHCNNCGRDLSLFYKTYKDYDDAVKSCPNCGSIELTRLISRVAFKKPSRDYTQMSSNEMLSVMESGDSRAMGEMFHQINPGGEMGAEYGEVTERLLSGEKPESIERDLSAGQVADSSASLPATPAPGGE
jgi:putative FmdB family regulatory protein